MPALIFWDTWAFIELADITAQYHKVAQQVVERLDHQSAILVTTQAVVTEVGNAYSKRKVRNLALRQLQYVKMREAKNMAILVPIGNDLWEAGWLLYEQRPDKDWGHTDCMSFVVMRDLNITKAFTADVHFEQAGFERLAKI